MCQPGECDGADRRTFLKGALAAGLVAQSQYAGALPLPRGTAGAVPTPLGPVRAWLARPAERGPRPAVLVLQGEVGLPDWMPNIAGELAEAGFVVLGLSRLSRYPELDDAALRADFAGPRRYLSEHFFLEEQQEQLGALAWLGRQTFVRSDRIGVVGFCGGGTRAVRLGIAAPTLRAIVSFYGPPALPAENKHPTDPVRDLVEIGDTVRVPLQMHYGTADPVMRAGDVDRLAGELRATRTPVEVHAYGGATHGFYVSDTPANLAAAGRARTSYLRFLHSRLG